MHKLLFASFVFCMFLSSPAASAAEDPSLKLHFNFDEDLSSGFVRDLSGNGNHGWQFNPTNWITLTNGVFGSTAGQWTINHTQYDHSGHVYPASQYLGVTNLSGISVMTNATISFWAKFDQNGDFGMQLLSAGFPSGYARGGRAAATNGWFIGRNFRTYLSFVIYPADASSRAVVNWPNDVVRPGGKNPDLTTLTFHQYTVTIDCVNNVATTYYDGRPYQTNTIDVPWIRVYGFPNPWLSVGTANMDGTPQWGDDLYPNSAYFSGRMDDLRIYDRVLTASEIAALYSGSEYISDLHVSAVQAETLDVCWNASPGVKYLVEATSDLQLANWTVVAAPFIAEETSQCVTISGPPGEGHRFFRVRALPL